MSVNTSIITDTGKLVTANTVDQYGAGVFVHVANSTWAEHSQVRVHTVPYLDDAGDTSGVYTLRMQLTRDNTGTPENVVLAMPIHATGTNVTTGTHPIIITQPANQNVGPGSDVQFYVTAISDGVMTYQWQKNQADLGGKTARNLILTNVVSADQARYRVVVANSHGSVTSNEGQLTVTTGARVLRLGSGGGFFSGLFG